MVFDEEGEHGGLGLVVVVAQHHDVGILAENAQRVFVVGLFALPNPRPSELVLPINQGERESTCMWRTRPNRIAPTIFGVPPSSRSVNTCVYLRLAPSSLAYRCVDASTKKIVPPPGRLGVSFTRSFFLRMRSPGQPTPPTILCGEKNSASQ